MNTKYYCARFVGNKEIAKKSSSGGVFFCLARYYIEQLSGVVYGAIIDDGIVFHKRISDLNEVYLLMKYLHLQPFQ